MIDNKATDTQLVSLYQQGSEEAFNKLFVRYKSKVYSTIYTIVKDKAIASDLAQDTFIKAMETIQNGKYNEEGKFLPWISRIARNLAIDHFRKEKRYPTVATDEHPSLLNKILFSDKSAEFHKVQKEVRVFLRKLIQLLPKEQKEIVLMRHYLEMSFQEIAANKGISINTALGRMRYALINLRKQITKYNLDIQLSN